MSFNICRFIIRAVTFISDGIAKSLIRFFFSHLVLIFHNTSSLEICLVYRHSFLLLFRSVWLGVFTQGRSSHSFRRERASEVDVTKICFFDCLFHHPASIFGDRKKRKKNEKFNLSRNSKGNLLQKKKHICYITYRCESNYQQNKKLKENHFPQQQQKWLRELEGANGKWFCCWLSISPRSVYNSVPKNTL